MERRTQPRTPEVADTAEVPQPVGVTLLDEEAAEKARINANYDAARVAHEVNRAYCASIGDDSHLPWFEAPEWQIVSACKGVEAIRANPDITPDQLHESWAAQKIADGWVYGETKDPEAKTHPCLRPYAELPAEQRTKDALFRAAVLASLGL